MNNSGLSQKLCSLIELHIGSEAARLYEKYYQDKDDELIKASTNALLSEVIGEEKAKLEMTRVLKFK